MNMHKRFVVIVSCILFTLLALLAGIITDLNDREFPQAIGSESRLDIRFTESDLSLNEAFLKIEELDAQLDLGLVKVAPDLSNEADGKIFVSLNDELRPRQFQFFSGNEIGKIVGNERLSNSYPDGLYLVTSNKARLDEFENALKDVGVKMTRRDSSILDSLMFIIQERGFSTVILASLALIASLTLFWLTVRARGRAIRVLGGSPTGRIQMQDLTHFSGAFVTSAVTIALVATVYVGLFHGWMFVSTFLKVFISLQVLVIVLSILLSFVLSSFAWPSAVMLATRQPAVKSLRLVAFVIQALTFVLVISMVSPAWLAFKDSSAKATEKAQWTKLADQVAIVFATEIHDIDRMESKIGEMVKDAESLEAVAFSYTYTKEMWSSVNFGEYAAVSFVNERWLDLVTKEMENSVVNSVSRDQLSKDLVLEIKEEINLLFKEEINLLSREKDGEHLLKQIEFLRPIEGVRLPVAQGGGGENLHFREDVLIVVIPSLYNTFNDFTLTSMISSTNLVFTGVTPTQQLLERHHLDVKSLRKIGINGELKVVYIAEEGILQAQFAAYLVWLQSLSLLALIIAFTVATAIRAWITATLQAKRDFPLRLAGQSWGQILKSRVVKELLVGIILVLIVIVLQKPNVVGTVWMIAAYGLLIVPLCHLFAVRWSFDGVRRRRI